MTETLQILYAAPQRFFHANRRGFRKHKGPLIETSLLPIKYATFAFLGCTTVRFAGYLDDPNTTSWMYARCGFIGGAVLAVPFLIRLVVSMEKEAEFTNNIVRDQSTLIVKEAIYSSMAACIGRQTMGGQGRYFSLLSMTAVGVTGAFVSFIILYVTLGIVLGILWIVMRCGVVRNKS